MITNHEVFAVASSGQRGERMPPSPPPRLPSLEVETEAGTGAVAAIAAAAAVAPKPAFGAIVQCEVCNKRT